MGAALTYARRYALFTLVGIAGEDDLDAPDLPWQTVEARRYSSRIVTATALTSTAASRRPNGKSHCSSAGDIECRNLMQPAR